MEVQLSPEQEAQLAALAAQEGRKPDELALDVLSRGLDDEARFVAAVKKGLDAADRGEFVPQNEVWERVELLLKS
jgi:predicted transcriptional regulator